MKFDILTIFPHIFDSYLAESILKRAIYKKLIKVTSHNLRDAARDRHRTVDDKPFGGGVGMIFKLEPLFKTLKKIKRAKKSLVILLDPAGKQFNHKLAKRLIQYDQLIFIAGRYEGVDARVDRFIDKKISIGPYVLSGGELPALVIIEALTRLLPGVLGKHESVDDETHAAKDYIEYPQYTRPEIFTYRHEGKIKKLSVPKILLSGNHGAIADWKKKHAK